MPNKLRIQVYHLTVLLLGSLAIGGCASGTNGKEYRRGQPPMLEDVEMGRVESVRDVLIETSRISGYRAPGVIVGGGIGHTIGGGRTGIGISLGTVLGGWGGASTGNSVSHQPGYEIMVRLDSGKLISVTQTAQESFRAGDRVRVLRRNDNARVSH